ncbi:MAG: 50S ribosomal protein L20 [Chlamydiota bacterium]|nr:50S ribosomal protein L20 [Chlamydiota bacterium]
MPRATNAPASRRRRRKVIEQTSGAYNSRSRLYKLAKLTLMRSLRYAYRDRKVRKRQFRALWISRIEAGAGQETLSYSRFMSGLKKAGVTLNRKMLSDLAINEKDTFSHLVKIAKETAVA